MRVREVFRQNLKKIPHWPGQKYLVAVSGGVDSMVLADLMRSAGVEMAIAHCNFGLRGEASNADEQLVREYARKHGIRLFTERCPVGQANIQLEARRLRYTFFRRVMQEHGYTVLLTAHHADDDIETFFINLLRGTGIRGLTGIPGEGDVRRPLAGLFRKEIEDFARRNAIPWREDESNRSDKYLRNRIRHRLIPLLEELSPDFQNRMAGTMERLAMSAKAQEAWFEDLRQKIIRESQAGLYVNVHDLPPRPLDKLFLYEWLRPLGFTDTGALNHLLTAGTSKRVYNADKIHLVLRQGDSLILMKVANDGFPAYRFDTLDRMQLPFVEWELISMARAREENYRQAPPDTAYIDADKLQPPYIWRPWQSGDKFRPLGLGGHKKVGDFLTDRRVPMPRRAGIYMFFSNGLPVWLAGYRLDEHFALDRGTKRVLRLRLHKGE